MVATVRTFHAEVTRDGKFWHIHIPELGRSTQARRYKDVSAMATDLIEIMSGLASKDYTLSTTVRLPGGVREHLARAEALRDEAGRKQSEAARESRAAVRELIELGLSQREAGEVLGLSFQRVNQLVRS
jgi:hypothetical protein